MFCSLRDTQVRMEPWDWDKKNLALDVSECGEEAHLQLPAEPPRSEVEI